jgi:hypothetical protein
MFIVPIAELIFEKRHKIGDYKKKTFVSQDLLPQVALAKRGWMS